MRAKKDNSLNWLIVFTESIASKATKKLYIQSFVCYPDTKLCEPFTNVLLVEAASGLNANLMTAYYLHNSIVMLVSKFNPMILQIYNDGSTAVMSPIVALIHICALAC